MGFYANLKAKLPVRILGMPSQESENNKNSILGTLSQESENEKIPIL